MTSVKDLTATGATIVGGQIIRFNVNLGRCTENGGFELNAAGKRFVDEYFTVEVQATEVAEPVEPPAPPAPRPKKQKSKSVAEAPSEDLDLGAFLDALPNE